MAALHPRRHQASSRRSTGSSSPSATSSGSSASARCAPPRSCRPSGPSSSATRGRFPRTKLLQQLKKHRGRAAFRVEEERRARLVAELQQARLTGVRFKVPAETLSAKLANLPEGVFVARGRIEVRFDGAGNALERLFALAQALGNDYVRFEELVGR